MKTLELSKARISLKEYLLQVNELPLILTSRGKPVAALIDVGDLDIENIVVGNSPIFQRIIRKSHESLQKHSGITIDEMRQRLGLSSQKDRSATRARKRASRKLKE